METSRGLAGSFGSDERKFLLALQKSKRFCCKSDRTLGYKVYPISYQAYRKIWRQINWGL